MIATRDPDTVINGHILAAARQTARIFARARAAMPHIAWYGGADDDVPTENPDVDSTPQTEGPSPL